MAAACVGAVHAPARVSAAGTEQRSADDPRLADMPVDIRPVEPERPLLPGPGDDQAQFGPTKGAEISITNADEWHAAGITGAGVKIGVIDFFDVERYWDTDEHGPLPVRGTTAKCYDRGDDCTKRYFDGRDDGGDDHGVAVVEVLRDMAPDAQVYIGSATTTSDYRRLIDWFARSGVRIVSRSLGSRYDGPGDGRGALDDVAAYANTKGITWVNSGGNNGDGRYYRQPARVVDGRIAFGPDGSTTSLRFNGCAALGGIRWANDWDVPAAERTDYDAYLWDSPTGSPLGSGSIVVATSTADQRAGAAPIEQFDSFACPSSSTRSLYLELRYRGGDIAGDVIEILDYGQGIARHTQAAYSATTPIADSRLPGVIAVGAVDPPAGGAIGSYSSQGPTNDGRVAPDVSAPSGFASTIFPYGFSGTSAAAPVVAGGVALLLDAGLATDPASTGGLVRHLTVDRGDAGVDNVFGAGEFRLPAPPDTVPADPSAFEPLDVPTRVLDTRPQSAVGPRSLRGPLSPGDVIDLDLGDVVTDDATAVAINVTVTESDRPSYLQVLPTLEAGVGAFSNVNIDGPGQTRSNFAIVPLSTDGSISVYLTGGGHVVIDLMGTFRRADGAVRDGRFVPLETPERVLDSRRNSGAPLGSGDRRELAWPSGVARDGVSALVLTVTATAATGPGWLQAYPTDRPGVVGTTSNVNVDVGQTVANTAIVPAGTDGVSIAVFVAGAGTTDVIVDVVGVITSDAADASETGRFVPVRPGRAYDGRDAGDMLDAGDPVIVDALRVLGDAVPDADTDAVSGVVWNVVPVDVVRPGFGRMWSGAIPEPKTSSFNFAAAGEVRSAAVISAVDGGRATVMLRDDGTGGPLGTVVVDVFGYFT